MKIGKNRLVALFFIVFGLFVLYQTSQIKNIFAVSAKDTGPKLFPYFCATCMIICSVIKFITAKETETYVPFMSKKGWVKVAIAFVIFVLYIIGMEQLGFLLVTPFVLFALVLLIAGEKKINKLVAAVYALIMTGAVYFAFHELMNVMLPAGKLFS